MLGRPQLARREFHSPDPNVHRSCRKRHPLSTFFKQRFGRSQFRPLDKQRRYNSAKRNEPDEVESHRSSILLPQCRLRELYRSLTRKVAFVQSPTRKRPAIDASLERKLDLTWKS